MNNNKKIPAIVTTLILTVITSVFWVFFTAYRSFTKSPDSVVPTEIIQPLNPKLDLEIIEKIKARSYLDSTENTTPEISEINITSESQP